MIRFCQITGKMPPLMWLCRTMLNYTDPILETNVMGHQLRQPVRPVGRPRQELRHGRRARPCRFRLRDGRLHHFTTLRRQSTPLVPPSARIRFDDGARGPGQRWFRRRDRTRRRCLAAHAEHAAERVDRTHERRPGGRSERRHRRLLHLHGACRRPHRDGRGERLLARTPPWGEPFTESAENLDKLFAALDRIERPQPTLVKMPLNKPWPQFKEFLDVLAAHNVQGVTIANLQKDRTGLDDIPKDWLGGLSGGPCTVASTELIRRTYAEYGDRFAIAASAACSPPNRPMRRFAPVPRSSCSSRRSCTAARSRSPY